MKKSFKNVIFTVFFIFSLQILNAQPLPPGGHGLNNDQPPGGGAPIGSGLLLSLSLSLGFLTYKYFVSGEHAPQDQK
jgi:hypothetical protein